MVSCPAPPGTAEGEDAPVDLSPAPAPTFTPEQYREAIRCKLQASPQAKHWVRVFCNSEGIRLMPAQREELEQVVKHHLLLRSPSPILQQEARQWFAENPQAGRVASELSERWQRFLAERFGENG